MSRGNKRVVDSGYIRKEKRFKRLLEKNSNSFVVIVRGQNTNLEEVLFVPSKEYRLNCAAHFLTDTKSVSPGK